MDGQRQRRFPASAVDVESVRRSIAEKWSYLDVMAQQFPAQDRTSGA